MMLFMVGLWQVHINIIWKVGKTVRTNECIPISSPWKYADVLYTLLENQDAPKEIL
jgi:hypothetical protein